MIRLILFLIFLVVSVPGSCQFIPFDNGRAVKVMLVDKRIELTKNAKTFQLNVSVKNNYHRNLILYAFIPEQSAPNEEHYMTAENSGRLAVFLVDRNGKFLRLRIRDAEGEVQHYQPINEDIVLKSLDLSRKLINDSKVVLKRGDSLNLRITVPLLTQHDFVPGNHRLYVIYYVGRNIASYIEVDKHLTGDALIYQGYSKSNSIQLTWKE